MTQEDRAQWWGEWWRKRLADSPLPEERKFPLDRYGLPWYAKVNPAKAIHGCQGGNN
ncbi:hypothetical protein hamaS1_26590 [Moorella sp. Hama-1]|nr:hypothetical protein hamaS1_26590 [Moorella sp. Hama-1]